MAVPYDRERAWVKCVFHPGPLFITEIYFYLPLEKEGV
jgi:hypothetical protein